MARVITLIHLLLIGLWKYETKASSLMSIQSELCGPETDVTLGEDGESSSVTIILTPSEQLDVCKLRISAPHSHVIYMHFEETASEMHREFLAEHLPTDRPCMLSVFVKENRGIPVWKGDPCSKDPLPEVDLLNPQLRLVWFPPDDVSHTRGRKLVVTSVGQGETCNNKGQHTCMSIGYKPLFCISNHLVCDGNHNCPKGATKSDEDEKICTFPFLSLAPDKFALELLKHLKPSHIANNQFFDTLLSRSTEPPSKYDNNIWKNWKNIQEEEITTVTTQRPMEEKHVSGIESFSLALSHYGPWGYIMLGMLICGTVLMFCGVWECLRKPKPSSETNQSQPSAVLIINNQPEASQPPHYDDIDPPSYTTLFPNFKLDVPPAGAQENQNAHLDNTDSATDNVQNQSESSAAEESTNNAVVREASESVNANSDIIDNTNVSESSISIAGASYSENSATNQHVTAT